MSKKIKGAAIALAAAVTLCAGFGLLAACSDNNNGNPIKTQQDIKHVFVITLENKDFEESFGTDRAASGQDTFLKQLATQGALLTEYFGTGHVSLDNYIAMMSGQPSTVDTETDCFALWSDIVDAGNDDSNAKVLKAGTDANGHAGGGCVYPARIKTFGNQLDDKGYGWKAYMGDMGNDLNRDGTMTCSFPTRTDLLAGKDVTKTKDLTQSAQAASASGDVKEDQYATRHNPFAYFHSVIDDTGYCDAHVVPLTYPDASGKGLEVDLKSADTTPNFVFVTPNLCDDGHDGDGTGAAGKGCKNGAPGGLASIDAFLQKWIPLIMNSPAYQKDGLIIINFDESNASSSPMTTTFNADYSQMNLTINLNGEACCKQQTGPNVKRPDDQILSTVPRAYASALGIDASQLPASVQTIQIGMHYVGVGGDRTGAVLLSKAIKPGTVSYTGYNHYSMLKSLEDIFSTGEYLGYADDADLLPFGSDVFTNLK